MQLIKSGQDILYSENKFFSWLFNRYSIIIGMLLPNAKLSLLLCLTNLFILMAQANHSAHFMTASFVTPASPKRVGPVNSVISTTTQLNAKKKAPMNTATKKVQVKLLKHIAGTGQAGQGA
jgi:hypothetical protein